MYNNKNEILPEQKTEEVQTPIETLNLSERTYKRLRIAGIDTVEKLLSLTEEELMGVRNISIIGYREVLQKIKEIKGIKETPIETLNLSERTYRRLYISGIDTVEKLLSLTEEELMGVRNITIIGYREVLQKIKEIKETPIETLNLSERENLTDEEAKIKSETTFIKEKLMLYKKMLESKLEQVEEKIKNIENNEQSKK